MAPQKNAKNAIDKREHSDESNSSEHVVPRDKTLCKYETRNSPACLFVGFGLDYFFAAVETVRRYVVTQMRFARCWLDSQRWVGQKVMRAVHATLGRRLLVLLNCHDCFSWFLNAKNIQRHSLSASDDFFSVANFANGNVFFGTVSI